MAIHLQCITDLVHEYAQSCGHSSLSTHVASRTWWFRLASGVDHVVVPVGECMICSVFQSMVASLNVSCCRQRVHCECLARSVHSCGDWCPSCTQNLVPILSDPLVAASLEHLDLPVDFDAPLANSVRNSFCVPDNMPSSHKKVLLTLIHWTTVGRSCPRFTHTPMVPPLLESFFCVGLSLLWFVHFHS